MPIAPALTTYPIISVTHNIEGILGANVFFKLFLGSVVISIEHETLTIFLKLKLPVFQSLENGDTF